MKNRRNSARLDQATESSIVRSPICFRFSLSSDDLFPSSDSESVLLIRQELNDQGEELEEQNPDQQDYIFRSELNSTRIPDQVVPA